jgi:4-aminobutyrate aminotransferase/(S)-3-amino-2-methylpropionate transaminase
MIAVELVHRDTTDPDPELTKLVASAAHRQGVIVLSCGTYGNVLRLLPPLSISDDLLVEALDVLAGVLAETDERTPAPTENEPTAATHIDREATP